MSAHTQTNLTATPGVAYFDRRGEVLAGYIITDDKGRWVAFVLGEGGISIPEAKANSKRLTACWNACRNLPTHVIEAIPEGVDRVMPIYRGMQGKLDVALATLKEAKEHIGGGSGIKEGLAFHALWLKVNDAIRLLEGTEA